MVKFCKYKKIGMKTKKIISPLLFTKNSKFYYEFRKYSFFLQFVDNENQFKPTQEEINFLSNYIKEKSNNIDNVDNNKYNIQILPLFYKAFQNLKELPVLFDPISNNIKNILVDYIDNSSISLTKIKTLYNQKFSKDISRTQIHRILKNRLHLVFRKTILKPKILENKIYKKISFLFIKSMIRALKLNFDLVFLDESNFKLKNNNYRMWRSLSDFCHYGNISRGKKNFLLAIGIDKIINFKLTTKNTDSFLFKKFFNETIEKIPKEKLKSTIFVMDNLTSHLTNEIKNIIKKKALKVFYTVPYESLFNPIELSFRAIKNQTYKKLYNNINELSVDIKNIIKSDNFRKTLYKNFIETLSKYLIFIKKNNDIDLNTIIK